MTMNDDNDPFACFGSDDDDDEEDDIDMNDRQLLDNNVTKTNNDNDNQKEINQNTVECIISSSSKVTEEQQKQNDNNNDNNMQYIPINPWSNYKPKYIHKSVQIMKQQKQQQNNQNVTLVGGGRCIVTQEDIPAGTLLLIEEPLFTWPTIQIGKELNLSSVDYILSLSQKQQQQHVNDNDNDDGMNILEAMEQLHPTKISVDNAYKNSNSTKNVNDNDDDVISIFKMMDKMEKEHPITQKKSIICK